MKKWLRKNLPKEYKQSKRLKEALSVCKHGVINIDILIRKSNYEDLGEFIFIVIGSISSSINYGGKVRSPAIFEATVKNNKIAGTDNISEALHFNSDENKIAEKILREIVLPWINEISSLEYLIPFIIATYSEEIEVEKKVPYGGKLIDFCRKTYPLRARTQVGLSSLFELYLINEQVHQARKVLSDYIIFIKQDWRDDNKRAEYIELLNNKLKSLDN